MDPQGQMIGKELLLGCLLFVSEENRPVKYTVMGTLVAALGACCHHPRYFGNLALIKLVAWRRKWQPTPAFLPGESQGRGSLVGCRLWGRRESDTTEVT